MFRVTTSLFVLSFFFCSVILAQSDTVIKSFSGLEDKFGNTHLIYQIYYSAIHGTNDTTRTDYYHLDLSSGTDTLIFDSYTITSNVLPPPSDIVGKSVVGFQFFNKNPNDFIFAYNYVYGDVSCGFGLPGMRDIYYGPGSIDYIQAYGDSVWANYGQKVIISSDKGKTWPEWNSDSSGVQFKLIGISPYNRNIYFGCGDYGQLLRSTDQGKTSSVVNQSDYWYYPSRLYFDRDGKHIYGINNQNYQSDILVSNNAGVENSWSVLVNNRSTKMLFAINDSISGEIYFVAGNKILKSIDYGATFTVLAELDQDINGLYKKPNSNLLYCSTRTFIYEVDGDQIKAVKRFSVKKAMEFYPLKIGNKWFYHVQGSYADLTPHPIDYYERIEIIRDTVSQNGKRFFIKKRVGDGSKFFETERMDSATGQIYYGLGELEPSGRLIGDLSTVPGNSEYLSFGFINEVTDSLNTIFGIKRRSKTFRFSSLDLMSRQYTEGLGIVKETHMFDFGYTTVSLTGCVIDGKLYGDTVMVDVDEPQKIPLQYKLLQNYPNPFNPITTIKYSVPVAEMRHASSLQSVTLKVYDVLGREVSTIIKEEKYPGNYEVEFDGSHMSSGIYFYQLRAGNDVVLTKKMTLLK